MASCHGRKVAGYLYILSEFSALIAYNSLDSDGNGVLDWMLGFAKLATEIFDPTEIHIHVPNTSHIPLLLVDDLNDVLNDANRRQSKAPGVSTTERLTTHTSGSPRR
jgi:hypothetical protein